MSLIWFTTIACYGVFLVIDELSKNRSRNPIEEKICKYCGILIILALVFGGLVETLNFLFTTLK